MDGGSAVDDLVDVDARHRGAEDHPRNVAARLSTVEPHGLDPPPDLRDVLDADPVQLDVLSVADVGGVARELGGDAGDGAQLDLREGATVRSDPQHEVGVVQLVGAELGRLPAVNAGTALRVKPPPTHPAAQVVHGDRPEALAGEDRLDPLPDVEAVVLEFEALVVVERRPVAVGPGPSGAGGGREGCGHASVIPSGGRRRGSGTPACQRRWP